jgi:hypothetical protein
MIASQHVDFDASFVALADSHSRFRAGRVIETDQATEHELRFDGHTRDFSALFNVAGILLAGQSQHAETETGQSLHVGKDPLAEVVADGLRLLFTVDEVGGAALNDALDSSLVKA